MLRSAIVEHIAPAGGSSPWRWRRSRTRAWRRHGSARRCSTAGTICDREGAHLAAAERVRRLLLANTNAPRAGQGCTTSTSCRAADRGTCDRHSTRRRLAPPLRAARSV